MDHSFGESENYHRPDEDELLDEYLAGVPLITIGEEERLRLIGRACPGRKNKNGVNAARP